MSLPGRDYVVQNICIDFKLKSIVAQQSETPVVFKLCVHWNGLLQAASEGHFLFRLIEVFYCNLETLWSTFKISCLYKTKTPLPNFQCTVYDTNGIIVFK